jgi:hypothetical protein
MAVRLLGAGLDSDLAGREGGSRVCETEEAADKKNKRNKSKTKQRMESCGCGLPCDWAGHDAHDWLQGDRQVHMTSKKSDAHHAQQGQAESGAKTFKLHLPAHGNNGQASEGQAVSTADAIGEVLVGERDPRLQTNRVLVLLWCKEGSLRR